MLLLLLFSPSSPSAEEHPGVSSLLPLRLADARPRLPPGTHVLFEAGSIEEFLTQLDGEPPDWAAVYGHGHHDQGHDERLFSLNRERDAKRTGNEALQWRIAFAWSGELSTYDPDLGGFHVVLGPRFTPTGWGLVRFKYEDLPGTLATIASPAQDKELSQQLGKDRSIEIDVVMIGTLIPEESLVYDFSHDQEGLGLIMPVVRVDTVLYLRAPAQPNP